MKSALSLLFAILGLQVGSLAQPLETTVIFQETFESADALSQWQIAPNGGRVRIVEDTRDSSNHGLLMDDADSDALFKQNSVSRTVSVKGFSGIRVAVDIFSFNDEFHNITNAFDGVILRAGNVTRRYSIQSLVEQRIETQLDFQLEEILRNSDGALTIELAQYDNLAAPDDGLFFDNVTVTGIKTRDIIVEAPLTIKESDPLKLKVLVSPVPTGPVTLSLVDNGNVRASATYPAGASIAELTFPSFENNQLDGDRWLSLYVTDGFFYSQWFGVRVQDNEFSGLSLNAPATIAEGTNSNVTVSISAPHENWLYIFLKSSDPSVLAVPDYVTVGFENRSVFQITTFENRRILADREVTISATLGSERVDWKVKVTERNSLIPTITAPLQLVEGAQDQNVSVNVDAISDQPLTINLSATPASVSVSPSTIVLSPGESLAYAKVSVADDNLTQGDRPYTITAQVGPNQQGSFTGKILDNEIVGFAFEMPERLQGGAPFSGTLHAVNQNASDVNAFNGTANVYLKDKITGEELLVRENLSFTQGRANFSLSLPYAARGSVLVARSPAGIVSTSAPLVMFMKLAFAGNDMVWDSKRQLLYVTSSANALPGHLNSVTKIDPVKGEIGQPLFLGNDPRKVVITDNGKYLYIGQWTSLSVRRVDLDSFTAVANIVLANDITWANNTYQPYDILPVPGRPLDVIVSQFHTGFSLRTTRLYVNGLMQAGAAIEGMDLAPGGSPDEFYSAASPTLTRLKLGGSSPGYTAVGSNNSVMSSYGSGGIVSQNDLVFANNGRVVDGKKFEALAEVKFPASWYPIYSWDNPIRMAADVPRSRIFYARGNTIAGYDTAVFQMVNETQLPGIGNISKIIRWGETGLALLTDQAEIVIFEDDRLVPTGAPTDLKVTVTATPQPVFLAEDLTYTATIENVSANVAKNARLSFEFNPGQAVKNVSSGGFAQVYQGTNIFVDIGDMAPGAKHQIVVTATPNALATLVATVGALTTSLDANYADNKATVVVNVGFKSQPNSVNVVKIPINDVIVQPVGGNLIVAIQSTAPSGIANRIMKIDPTSGLITASIAIPGEPWKLAVSDDGTTAYAISLQRNTAYQVNLATGQFVRTVSFNTPNQTISAFDIKVLPGTTGSIVIAGSSEGVRVYDNGVQRSQNTGTYSGAVLALLPDPKLAFGVDGSFGAFKYEISATGVKVLSQIRDSIYASSIKSDGYYVYTEGGREFRADLMTLTGTFDLLTAFSSSSSSPIAVEPERAKQRIYFARDNRIASFHPENYLKVRAEAFDLPSKMLSLSRWGKDGFAARLENGELAIIRSDMVPDAASPIDLIVALPDTIEVNAPQLIVTGQAFHGQGIASVKVGSVNATSSNGFGSWAASVDGLVEGENIVTITATSLGVPADTRTVTRKVIYTPTASSGVPESWIVAQFGSLTAPNSGPGDDPDGDGQSNLREYLFGTNPLFADKPQFSVAQEIDGTVTVSVTRRNTPDFDFAIESSNDFITWQSATTQNTVVPGEAFLITKTAAPASPEQPLFYRVKATKK